MNNKPLKLMILGIAIMLLGIYFHVEIGLSQRLCGNEFYIVVVGFILSLIGFFHKD